MMSTNDDSLALHIARSAIGSDKDETAKLQNPQAELRLAITDAWDSIKTSFRILELGCGQGDMTAVLATLVGPSGRIFALDPADPENYGAPWTLKQAQDHLSSTEIGARIKWIHSDAIKYLEETEEVFDAVVLSQCLWYFPSVKAIADTLRTIKKLKGSPRLLLAEYALESQHAEALPHILAAITQGAMEVHKSTSESNIRTLITPSALRQCAEECGWRLISERKITPDVAYQDGRWEVGAVLENKFLDEINDVVPEGRYREVVNALREAVVANAGRFERRTWRSMNIWAGSFN